MIVTVAFPAATNTNSNASTNARSGYDVSLDASGLKMSDASGTPIGSSSLSRKESYKDQRKKYRHEKKRVARELLSTLKDPAVVVLADWLKIRGSLKGWTKLWCVLKPGMLLLYKSTKAKSSHWVGTVLLNTCELIERPSKKDGFCFKLFHPLEQSIWATKGPEGETIGAVVQPLPSSHLIFRAPSQAAGKCWMDALELAVRCSSILIRSMTSPNKTDANNSINSKILDADKWDEADYEKHFKDQGESDDSSAGGSNDGSPIMSPESSWKEQIFQLPPSSSVEVTPTRNPGGAVNRDPSPTPYYRKLAHAIAIADQELKENQPTPRKRYSLTPEDAYLADQSQSATPETAEALDKKKNYFFRGNLKHPNGDLDDASHTDENEHHRESGHFSGLDAMSGSESESEDGSHHEAEEDPHELEDIAPQETPYGPGKEGEMGEAGGQVEELEEENKSLIWFLLKQVRPGMDLAKVVLPTFILEPRSFLDKLSDYYYHADIIPKAVQEDDPYTRMKEVVRWYLSGFYKKPKGLKKPYNPILGETFRCFWKHPNGSRTFYIAEQVSHHPPISAFYVTNRQEGFSVSATVLAKSKFYGNSTSAILDGNILLSLLPRGEDYIMNMPYAHCKGILMGTLTMELGGKVNIECEKTGYVCELEFKLKPFLSGTDANNLLTGKLKLGKDTMATLEGHWDGKIVLVDKRTGEEEVLWHPTPEVKAQRMTRYTVPMESQGETESENLWKLVTQAIDNEDQVAATEEKTILEEAQRSALRERQAKCEDWVSKYFTQDPLTGVYLYKHSDLRPWDPRTDLFQYESKYVVSTKSRYKAPIIRTGSIISVDPKLELGHVSSTRLRGVLERVVAEETSSGDHDDLHDTDTTGGGTKTHTHTHTKRRERDHGNSVAESIVKLSIVQETLVTEVKGLRKDIDGLQRRLTAVGTPQKRIMGGGSSTSSSGSGHLGTQSWASILVALILYSLIQWLYEKIRS
ncbi:unnamed protein product, partial [Meganyctiphanes norvegica]